MTTCKQAPLSCKQMLVWFGLLALNASATARSYRGSDDDDDDEMSVSLVESTAVPGGNHRPMASN